ncbi:aminoglycoside phosphotransferase family protein [Mangrovicoccus algicola]|uniref:Phosphotransferase n=1 Tax=Mangrovicoccus algicola TaxID=2771008 RepID=A0A8J6Z2A4_9RHOB|nr:phosphotransferase [Mangrovicoccus algicola]MBE3640326.1 phosphotransferase [Mangrovicoccus algicola]
MQTDPFRDFLDAAGWGAAMLHPLAGDASNRRYSRVAAPDGRRAVLMDAPPERGEDVRPFLAIARHLSGLGLSAPAILAAEEARGLLLIEDLGDGLFARLAAADPACEEPLYLAAIEVLAELSRHAAPAGLMPYDSTTMPDLGALALDWYLHGGDRGADPATRAALAEALRAALAPHDGPRVLVQRDYHAENLLWLPERAGAARVGLLDFQDAAAGHPAYDLVSLLEDARRDVSPATVAAAKAHYLALTGADPETFATAYAAMGAQRNLRIIGVFARLSLHFGKPHYVDLIPRVWDHLMTDLAHPSLAGLYDIVRHALPQPTPTRLEELKARCGTVPTL